MEGTVKWFNQNKGYGFVEGDDGQEYFVHYSALAEGVSLQDKDRISFDSVDTEKGKQAKDVTLIEG